MAEMRLVVAGAGGRMGRTLVKAIADSKGFALAGALEDARSPLIGRDAGTLAGLGQNGIKLYRRRRRRCWSRPTASSISPCRPPPSLRGARRRRPARCTSSAPPA